MPGVTVKGSGIKPCVEWIRERHGEALLATVLDELDVTERQTLGMLNTGFAYPVELFDSFLTTYARVAGLTDLSSAERAFRDMGTYSASSALTGIFSAFLKVSSPKGTFKRVANLLPMVYAGIESSIDIQEDDQDVHALLTIRGLGGLSYAGPRLCGYGEEGLRRSGLAAPHIEERSWSAGLIKADPLMYEARWPKE